MDRRQFLTTTAAGAAGLGLWGGHPRLLLADEVGLGKTIEAFKGDLAKVRTGRAHTGLLDHVMVDYYGSATPLNQVAKVILVDSRTIGVTPFEKKMVQTIDKSIREAEPLVKTLMDDLGATIIKVEGE